MLNEEDGKVLARVIGQHEALLVSRAAARERKREETTISGRTNEHI